jgi:hypothetical protein
MYGGTTVKFQLTEQLGSANVLFNTEYVLQSSVPTIAVLFSGCSASTILLIRMKLDSRGLAAVIS